MQKGITYFSALIDSFLRNYSFRGKPLELYEPIDYIMSLGGKRMRPYLVLLSYNLFKNNSEVIIKPALSVEVFHNFTLMHDDIMDEAPLRRGKDTVHKKWNENIAILSGDVMLVEAYKLLMELEGDILKKVIERFNTTAAEVCEGQQLDMNFEIADRVTIEQYLEMIRLKTAVLLGFSLELGGMLARASDNTCLKLNQAGINMGLGFQLMDDLLDVYADSDKFGKQTGGDILSNKKTFLLLKSLEISNKEQRKELEYWISAKTFEPLEKINSVKKLYDQLNIKDITTQEIKQHFNKSIDLIDSLSSSPESKAILINYIQKLIHREK